MVVEERNNRDENKEEELAEEEVNLSSCRDKSEEATTSPRSLAGRSSKPGPPGETGAWRDAGGGTGKSQHWWRQKLWDCCDAKS